MSERPILIPAVPISLDELRQKYPPAELATELRIPTIEELDRTEYERNYRRIFGHD